MDFITTHLDPATWLGAVLLTMFGATTPMPAEVTSLTVAMKHAAVPAFILIWVGTMLGAVLSYGLATWLGTLPIVRRLGILARARETLENLTREGRSGFVGMAGLRLIPIVPFSALSIAAGLLGVSRRDYYLGTAVGILPAVLVITLAGQGLTSGNGWVIAMTVLGLLVVAALVWWESRSRKRRTALRHDRKPHID